MPVDDCIKKIQKKIGEGELVTDVDIEAEVRDIDARIKQLESGMPIGNVKSINDYMKKKTIRQKQRALDFKRTILFNIKSELYRTRITDELKKSVGLSPRKAITAQLVGLWRPFKGAQMSTAAMQIAEFHGILGKMRNEFLADKALSEAVSSGAIERAIVQELREIYPGGKTGISGNKHAQVAARIMADYMATSFEMVRANGGPGSVLTSVGYTPLYHDAAAILKAGKFDWIRFIVDNKILDAERTLIDVVPTKDMTRNEQLEQFLSLVYDGIVGDKEGFTPKPGDILREGPKNLADALSQHKALFIADADKYIMYRDRFSGGATIAEAVAKKLETDVTNAVIMREWGPIPYNTFRNLIEREKRLALTTGEKADLDSYRLKMYWSEVSGDSNIAANVNRAAYFAGLRALINLSKLGRVFWASLTDVPMMMLAASLNGHGVVGGILHGGKAALEGLFRGPLGDFERGVANSIGVFSDGVLFGTHRRFMADDTTFGMIAKWQETFFRVSLIKFWTDRTKEGFALMLANDLARWRNLKHIELDPEYRNTLIRYGMGEKEWSIINDIPSVAENGESTIAMGGREYVTPDLIHEVEDGRIAEYMRDSGVRKGDINPNTIRKTKVNLENALRSYMLNEIDFAVPTPGARERAIVKLGFQRGSWVGEAARLLMQYKAFPITIATKMGGRLGAQNIFTGEWGKVNITGLSQLLITTTIMGYISMSSKDVMKGLRPRDPTDKTGDVLMASFLAGGGAGIYGDFLFGEYNRFGRGVFSTVAGPAYGEAEEIIRTFFAGKSKIGNIVAGDQDNTKLMAKTFRIVLNNAPFLNLHMARAALDYAILNDAQEYLNPGYKMRRKRNLKNRYGQTMLLPMSMLGRNP
jgi:hypothetical protein